MTFLERPVTPKEFLKRNLFNRKIAFQNFVVDINKELEQGRSLIKLPLCSNNKISLHEVFFLIRRYYKKYGWYEVTYKKVMQQKHVVHFIPKKNK